MLTARALLQGHIDGLTAEGLTPSTVPISCAWAVPDAQGQIDLIDFPPGDTVVSVPRYAAGRLLVLLLPPTNAVPIFLKGGITDSGISLVPNCGHVLAIQQPSIVFHVISNPIPGVRLIWL